MRTVGTIFSFHYTIGLNIQRCSSSFFNRQDVTQLLEMVIQNCFFDLRISSLEFQMDTSSLSLYLSRSQSCLILYSRRFRTFPEIVHNHYNIIICRVPFWKGLRNANILYLEWATNMVLLYSRFRSLRGIILTDTLSARFFDLEEDLPKIWVGIQNWFF